MADDTGDTGDADDTDGFLREGVFSWLEPQVTERGDGRVVMRFDHQERITNPGSDIVNGGVVATLVDTACGTAVATRFDDDRHYATTDLDVSYLRPAAGDITAEAEVARAGDSVAVARATVESPTLDGEPAEVAIGSASFRVL